MTDKKNHYISILMIRKTPPEAGRENHTWQGYLDREKYESLVMSRLQEVSVFPERQWYPTML